MQPSTALYQLKIMPKEFLDNNFVMIAGRAVSGDAQSYIGVHPAFDPTEKLASGAASEYFAIDANGPNMPKAHAFKAHNVRMIRSSEELDFGAIEGYALGSTGSDYMITGQLSGCAFVVLGSGASLTVAHIQPGGKRGTGAKLKQTLEESGRFADSKDPLTKVFGSGDYQAYAHVMGVRRGSGWEIYGQEYIGMPGPEASIIKVTRIA